MMIQYVGTIGKNAEEIKAALGARVTLIQKPSCVDTEIAQYGGGSITLFFASDLSAYDEVDLDSYMDSIGYS